MDKLDVNNKIWDKFEKKLKNYGIDNPYNKCENPKMSFMMDLESMFEEFNINAEKFLEADDETFMHDLAGMYSHLVRTTFPAKMGDCFVPRFANH